MPISAQPADFVVNTTITNDQKTSSIALMADGRMFIVYRSFDNGDGTPNTIRGRLLDPHGNPLGDDFIINATGTGTQLNPSASAMPDGRIFVTWESSDPGDGSGKCIRATILDPSDLSARPPDFLVNNTVLMGDQIEPVAATNADGLTLVAWTSASGDGSGTSIQAGFIKPDGTPLAIDFTANTTTANDQTQAAVTALANGFLLTWKSDSADGPGIRARLFNADGTPRGNEFAVADSTSGNQQQAAVTALANGGFAIVWRDGEIKFRLFNADGSPAGTEMQVNTTTLESQSSPSIIELADGRFAVAYVTGGGSDGSADGIAIQILDAGGGPIGTDFIATTTTLNSQDEPVLKALPDGRFILSFSDYSQTGDDVEAHAVRARIFDPTIFNATTGGGIWVGAKLTDKMYGGTGHDQFYGRDGDDVLSGGGNDDLLWGEKGNDLLLGGADQDVLRGGAGRDSVYGGTGNDRLEISYGDDSAGEFYDGGSGEDSLALVAGTNSSLSVDLTDDKITGIETIKFTSDGNEGALTGTMSLRLLASQVLSVQNIQSFSATAVADRLTIVMGNLSVANFSSISVTGFNGPNDILSILGDGSAETITGTAAGDIIRGAGGKDSLNGGAGIDTADYSDKTQKIEVTLNRSTTATVKVNGVAEDSIKNIENIFGGSAGDKLTGDSLDNLFRGGGGKDSIDGASGSDTADYSDKTKRVEVALNKSTAVTVSVDGKAEDSIKNTENIIGGSAGDKLTGDSLANLFRGGAGKDSIDGGAGIDTADYSDKTQKIEVTLNKSTTATVKVNGVAEDSIKNIENIIGGSGDDSITGDGNANMLDGGAGNDTLRGGAGKDTVRGGDGNDEIHINALTDIVAGEIYDGGAGTADVLRLVDTASDDVLHAPYTADLRNVTLAGFEVLRFGDPGGGQSATVRLNAAQFGAGLSLTAEIQGVHVWEDYADVANTLEITMGSTVSLDLSGLTFAHGFGETGQFGNDKIVILGDDSSERITGTSIADSILAGGGNDTIVASAGQDTIDGGSGSDWLMFSPSDTAVRILLADGGAAATVGGGASDLTIRNIENVVGTGGGDYLVGNSADNIFRSMGGPDTIYGGAGNDTADYSENTAGVHVEIALDDGGDAYVFIGIGNDSPYYEDALLSIENLIGGGGNDLLYGGNPANRFDGGGGNDTLSGGGGKDTLIGGTGNDSIIGGTGNDSIIGGAGKDTLSGGDNDDRFVFAPGDSGTGSNVDVITDFDDFGDDIIDLSAFAGTLTYRGTSAFTGLNQVRVVASGADVLVHINTTGNTNPDFTIKLAGTTIGSMTQSDFIL